MFEDKKKLEVLSSMWDRERNMVREFYMSNMGQSKNQSSPTKKNKLQANKLLNISEDVKLQLLEKYLKKCKTEFNICFIEHRLDLNPSNFNPKIYKYLDELKIELKVYDKELFTGVK